MNSIDIDFEKDITLEKTDALIVIDIQNDFIPNGSLPVPKGNKILTGVNNLTRKFFENNNKVIFTQDWHPIHHASFASEYADKKPLDPFSDKEGIGPVLWPDHCVQGTHGAQFPKELLTHYAHLIIRKGYNPKIDSYSAFLENDKKTETGLAGYLKNTGINRVFLCGLALDYCVYYSAIDAFEKGYETIVILDLTKGIDFPSGSIKKTVNHLQSIGAKFINSSNIHISSK